MNRELEAILKAYDAAGQAQGDAAIRLKEDYELRIAQVLEKHPNLSRHALELTIELAYSRWKKAETKYPTLPPRA